MKYIIVCLGITFSGLFASANYFDKGVEAVQARDYKGAKVHFERACEGEIAEGCYALGMLYYNGQGVKKNYHQAKAFFRRAREGGYTGGLAHTR